MTINTHNDEAPAPYLEWTLGDRLSRSLRHSGLGVGEMAELLGVGRETVSRWMNDRVTPKRAALLAWATITNVSMSWLETGDAPTAPNLVDLLPRLDSNQQPSGYRPRANLRIVS